MGYAERLSNLEKHWTLKVSFANVSVPYFEDLKMRWWRKWTGLHYAWWS